MSVQAYHELLEADDGPAVLTWNPEGASPLLFVCDHASNRIPRALGALGLAPDVLQSHIAWDPGAIEVARRLAEAFDAVLVWAGFSRLIYDVNRPPESPEAMRATSEIYDIPGNSQLSAQQREARIEAIYRPFHERIDGLIRARADSGRQTVLVTVHSFTPLYLGARREVELGILHDEDARLADAMLRRAFQVTSLITRRNEPYSPADGVTHTLVRHALPRRLLNVMLEIRNDLIRTAASQSYIAAMLAAMLRAALQSLAVSPGIALKSRE